MANDVSATTATVSSLNAARSSVSRIRSKSKNPFDSVLEKARAIFNRQLDRSSETKRKVIEKVLSAQEASYTQKQFLAEYVNRVARLLDSKSYCKECKSLNMDSYSVATHIAFDGVRQTLQVIEKGLDKSYSNLFSEMEEAVFPLNVLKDFDKKNLLEDVANETNSDVVA